MDAWVSNPFANTASVANTYLLGQTSVPMCMVMTLSSGMCLLQKN